MVQKPATCAPQEGEVVIAPGEDLFIARYIETYIHKRSEAVDQKAEAISVEKANGVILEGEYRSEWDIVVKFRLTYMTPEEEPFLAGMVKCFQEKTASSRAEWREWAEDEISQYRNDVQSAMSFAQDSTETVTVVAKISDAGYIDAATICLGIEGVEKAAPAEILLANVPSHASFEMAGYEHLASGEKPSEDEPASGEGMGQQTTPVPGVHSKTNGAEVSSQSSAPSQQITNTGKTQRPPITSSDSATHLQQTGLIVGALAILTFLLTVLVLSEARRVSRK